MNSPLSSLVVVLIVLLFVGTLGVELPNSAMPDFNMPREEREQWCITMNKKYEIIPGMSFGKLTVPYQKGYLKMDCDEFFCKPHPKRGRGSYTCEPLDQ